MFSLATLNHFWRSSSKLFNLRRICSDSISSTALRLLSSSISLFSAITLLDGDAVKDEIDDAHDPDVLISSIGVAENFNVLLAGFEIFPGEVLGFIIALSTVLKFFGGVALTRDFSVDEGSFLMVVAFPSLLRFAHSSLVSSLNRGTTFEPKSRLIDGFGCFDVESGSGGALSSPAGGVWFLVPRPPFLFLVNLI